MMWDLTFELFGMDADGVASKLGVRETDYSFETGLKTPYKIVKKNNYQKKLYRSFNRNDLLGIITQSSSRPNNEYRPNNGHSVYRRNEERTYIVRLDESVPIKIKENGEELEERLNCFFVKTWSPYNYWNSYNSSTSKMATREFNELQQIDKHNLQTPTTIPVAMIETDRYVQLIKIREPIVAFNDLPKLWPSENFGLLSKKQNQKRKQFESLLTEGLKNWGALAKNDHYQFDITALDHNDGEGWFHDFGDKKEEAIEPGMIKKGDIDKPCNIGIIKHNGEEHCIVRDLEHVMTKKGLQEEPLPHENDTNVGLVVGDRFTSRLGRVLTSITLMGGYTGLLLGLSEKDVRQTLNRAFTEAYNHFYGRERVKKFDIDSGVITEIKNYIRNGSLQPNRLTLLNDHFIAPEYMRVGLDIIDGTYFDDKRRRAKLRNKAELLDRFTEACEKDWDRIDETMDNLVILSGYEDPSETVCPRKLIPNILNRVSDVVVKNPKLALTLSERVLEVEPDTQQEINEIFKVVR